MDLQNNVASTTIQLNRVTVDNGVIFFKKPFYLEVKYDSDVKLYDVEYIELNINILSDSMDGLITKLHDHIELLWHNYAMDDNDRGMTNYARFLKYNLLDMVEFIEG